MIIVSPPSQGLFRVSRADRPVFSAPEWPHTGGGRFDDPRRVVELAFDPGRHFRIVYAATTLTAAFVESLQALRPSLATIAQLGDAALPTGHISPNWRERRRWGHATLPANTTCIDLTASETLRDLRTDRALARIATDLGLPDIDLSAVAGPHRQLTQAIARAIHSGFPNIAGLRYTSRFGTGSEFECWALFAGRFQVTAVAAHQIERNDTALQSAADLLTLAID